MRNQSIKLRSLSGKKKFSEIFRQGKRVFFGCGYVVFMPSGEDEAGNVYAGIIVRKKLGNAVERNRAKRAIREILRKVLQAEEKKRAFAIIFVLNKVDIDRKEVKKAIGKVLKSINNYSGEKG